MNGLLVVLVGVLIAMFLHYMLGFVVVLIGLVLLLAPLVRR